ncbi:MAG: HelD family protein [Acidimicrobiales bacterium]
MQHHPDLAAEQAHLDRAYACLERDRAEAWRMRALTEVGSGGTHQARYEAEVIEEAISTRLTQLDLHRHALVFGRIDRTDADGTVESFHIGRLAVSDEHREPVVVDWRAPVAEPFYRATGRQPMGLVRRRHFASTERRIVGIEDELFGEGHLGIGADAPEGIRGWSTLLAALERGRTGQLGDIVATIQAEQDEIIRSPQAGVLVVQGGPGTGKTVVALHRAAYLLYTYRFPLEDQGVLVIGPNRLFLRYIERVLPSLGESGVEQVVLTDLVPDVRFGGRDDARVAWVKGDGRMSEVIGKAVRDRQRPVREDVLVPFGTAYLRLRAAESERIVLAAKRRFRRHNAARRYVEQEVFAALAASAREDVEPDVVRDRTRHTDEVRTTLERMWPVLTPPQLLHDLFGSRALLKLAASRWLTEAEYLSLYRQRHDHLGDVVWTASDAALLDEARALLGPKPDRRGRLPEEDEIRTYGHIVIDEVQDLTPMELRMAARRSLNGSMTVVGDIAQATGAHAPADWDDVLAHLPDRRAPRIAELTVGYRIPGTAMALAARVLRVAAPRLAAPRAVREGDRPPSFHRVAPGGDLGADVAAAVRVLLDDLGDGTVGVLTPAGLVPVISRALTAAGIDHGMATRSGLEQTVTVVPVGLVKGLELDGVVVVEPARIVADEPQGLRALYVALTRATRQLAIVHAAPLPEALA